ncbi:MAG: [Fe-Fe] hydrogenase large subunit C-terminal domain-containing protein [Oscillospiraceae bacterium]
MIQKTEINMKFTALYERLAKASLENRLDGEVKNLRADDFDPHQLDCLLNPKKYPVVFPAGKCACEGDSACVESCAFEAISRDASGNISVNNNCVGCAACIAACKTNNITPSKDVVPVLEAVAKANVPVYAMIAPAFVNQYSPQVTPGKLRAAFKKLGFTGMLEVALFADILTLKEALEFDRNIQNEKDFQLTSCCCPMWIAMIRRVYKELVPHLPASVSPMVACGRSVKQLHPDALTVFVGPCMAKKSEAREPDVSASTDYVLTFQEMQEIFDLAGIDPAALPEDERDHSSRAGRIYAATGGVSEAVQSTVARMNPDRKIAVKAVQADGVPACKKLLADILSGEFSANFIEGMGCVGGCVGGPKILIPKEQGRENVRLYGEEAAYKTPIDNPYVIELLHRLGFDTVESLLEESDIFTRKF